MSGGHFDYNQYKISYIADEVEQLIYHNDSDIIDERGNYKCGSPFSEKTIAEFKKGLLILRQAEIYAQRIDWLVSGDDSEESFLARLQSDLKRVQV
jgi:hypothetical protein